MIMIMDLICFASLCFTVDNKAPEGFTKYPPNRRLLMIRNTFMTPVEPAYQDILYS
jgi:hypothetical protein